MHAPHQVKQYHSFTKSYLSEYKVYTSLEHRFHCSNRLYLRFQQLRRRIELGRERPQRALALELTSGQRERLGRALDAKPSLRDVAVTRCLRLEVRLPWLSYPALLYLIQSKAHPRTSAPVLFGLTTPNPILGAAAHY